MGIFRFKRFSVENINSAMKVGTDAVLLGAWMRCSESDLKILDIGCGTGIISLMAAQRTPSASITAIDIDEVSCTEAGINFSRSPWAERLTVMNISLQEYAAGFSGKAKDFDHIFSNPPYFNDSLKCPELRKSSARHTDTLPFNDLAYAVSELLSAEGRFSLILPDSECGRFIKEAEGKLWLSRECLVSTSPGKPAKRRLMEFLRHDCSPERECMTIQEKGKYTPAYISLTRDFHPFL